MTDCSYYVVQEKLECIYNLLALPKYGRNYSATGNKPKQVRKKQFDIRNFNNLKNRIVVEVTFALTVFIL